MKYECSTNTWHDSSLQMRGECMIAHPWHSGCAIELMDDGNVHVVREIDGRIIKSFKSKYGKIELKPEMLGLCDTAEGEFILLVCDGTNSHGVSSPQRQTRGQRWTGLPQMDKQAHHSSIQPHTTFIITSMETLDGHASHRRKAHHSHLSHLMTSQSEQETRQSFHAMRSSR